jgi:hypothetical protein
MHRNSDTSPSRPLYSPDTSHSRSHYSPASTPSRPQCSATTPSRPQDSAYSCLCPSILLLLLPPGRSILLILLPRVPSICLTIRFPNALGLC